MGEVKLKIDDLVLDTDNPRITHAAGQQEALQKVVREQKGKLVRLAESIVERGLSPIEKLMVMEVSPKPKRFIPLEGNRRVTALRLLTNPAALTGLEMAPATRKSLERLVA
jgi:ParB-like chromosome segregation protein Spo0J